MSGFVVTVEFRLKSGDLDGFLELVTENARLSAGTEPGCRQFDVIVPQGEENCVFLFEVYDDESSFESHNATKHFAEFDRQSASMVSTKRVMVGKLHYSGRGN